MSIVNKQRSKNKTEDILYFEIHKERNRPFYQLSLLNGRIDMPKLYSSCATCNTSKENYDEKISLPSFS